MTVVNLYSGSGGNCTYVKVGDRRILIDAGGTFKALSRELNKIDVDFREITDIFITHEHGDHTHALSVFLKKHPTRVHMTKTVAKAMGIKDDSVLFPCTFTYENEFFVELSNGCKIKAFIVPHDSLQCVGYVIDDGEERVGIATDLGYATQNVYDSLRGCTSVIIEANHDTEMVRNGCYPQALKTRILSGGGHLSNTDCAELCSALARAGTKKIMLTHLSRENNTVECAFNTVNEGIKKYGVSLFVSKCDKATVFI